MKSIIFLSDSHGKHESIYVLKDGDSLENTETLYHITGGIFLPSEADIIIHAGDISMGGTEYEIEKFLKWYSKLPYPSKILIAGNHDKLFDFQRSIAKEILKKYPEITYLESQEVVINGIKIYGEPVSPTFGYGWAFNADRGEKIKKHWDAIPDDVDICILHCPPKGILDMTIRGENVGCEDLLYRLMEIKPKIVVYGHIHEHYGHEIINDIHFFNASVLNLRYQLQNKPWIIEIDDNKNIKVIK